MDLLTCYFYTTADIMLEIGSTSVTKEKILHPSFTVNQQSVSL